MKIEQQQQLFDALQKIKAFMTPEQLRKCAEKKYGLSPEDAIEMAYENVLTEAYAALRGIRRPKDPA